MPDPSVGQSRTSPDLSVLAADVVAAWDATAGPDQREWFPWLHDAIQKLRKALPPDVVAPPEPPVGASGQSTGSVG